MVVVALIGGVDRLPLPPPLDLRDRLARLCRWRWCGWLAVTNFYNFMDGIDGLAGGQGFASCAGVIIGLWSAGAVELAVVLAAACLGFLLLNSPPGPDLSRRCRELLARLRDRRPAAAGAAVRTSRWPCSRVAIGLTLFLLDPLETLVRLVRAGRRIGIAHRAHSYQAARVDEGSAPARHAWRWC